MTGVFARTRKILTITLAITGVTLGLAGPALAEGGFTSVLNRWDEGTSSRTWVDRNLDSVNTSAAFSNCSKLDFRITIYKEDAGPDTQVGTETMQCTHALGHGDAVYAGDVAADEYHFTMKTGVDVSADVKVNF